MTARVALVTGANKGLGFEIVRQLAGKGIKVILTARDPSKGEKAAHILQAEKLDVVFVPMDVTRVPSVSSAFQWVKNKYGRLDVLVNNAGIFTKEDKQKNGLDISPEIVRETFETNTLAPLYVSQTFIPLMKKNRYGRIVNMSSGLGTLSEMSAKFPAYRISKAALNAVTCILAGELKGTNILVNSMCPGWCRTDMGGALATRSAAEGATTAVYLATLPDDGPTGGYFRDQQVIAW